MALACKGRKLAKLGGVTHAARKRILSRVGLTEEKAVQLEGECAAPDIGGSACAPPPPMSESSPNSIEGVLTQWEAERAEQTPPKKKTKTRPRPTRRLAKKIRGQEEQRTSLQEEQ